MSALRDAATRIASMGRFPTPPSDRLLGVEKALRRLDRLETGIRHEPEPWDDFLRRIGLTDG